MRVRLGWPDLLPIALGVTFAVYGIYLLITGQTWVVVTPDVPGSVTIHERSVQGLFPLAAGLLVLSGIWLHRERLVWGGGALALLFSVAFLFSVAGLFIPVAVLLILSLTLRSFISRRRTSHR